MFTIEQKAGINQPFSLNSAGTQTLKNWNPIWYDEDQTKDL
jgi:hypothetical protein